MLSLQRLAGNSAVTQAIAAARSQNGERSADADQAVSVMGVEGLDIEIFRF
jgi:hypothetical protein